jgi:hypothetical protein
MWTFPGIARPTPRSTVHMRQQPQSARPVASIRPRERLRLMVQHEQGEGTDQAGSTVSPVSSQTLPDQTMPASLESQLVTGP